MPSYRDTSVEFTERPVAPKEFIDTANLLKAVTGRRPNYYFDVNAGEWTLVSSADTGHWPDAFIFMVGAGDSGDAVPLLLSTEESEDGSGGTVWLHIGGDFGELRVGLQAGDARLWAKLLKKAAKRVDW